MANLVAPSLDPRARLFQEHRRYVLGIVRACGVEDRYLEDVCQDVFLEVYRCLDRYDPSIPFKPWLKTIAKRVAWGFLRRKSNRLELLSPAPEGLDAADPGPGPDHPIVLSEAQRLLIEAVRLLDDDRRQVYWLHVVEQIPVADVARQLHVKEGTVRSRLKRAEDEIEAALHRLRVAERRRSGVSESAAFLLSPGALVDAARGGADGAIYLKAYAWVSLARAVTASGISDGLITGAGVCAGAGVAALGAGLTGAHAAAGLVATFVIGTGLGYLAGAHDGPPAATRAGAEIHREERLDSAALLPEPSARCVPSSGATAAPVSNPVTTGSGDAPVVVRSAVPDRRAELLVLNRARQALAAGDPDEAIRAANEHARRFPRGWLASTRRVIQREAREAQQREAEGR